MTFLVKLFSLSFPRYSIHNFLISLLSESLLVECLLLISLWTHHSH